MDSELDQAAGFIVKEISWLEPSPLSNERRCGFFQFETNRAEARSEGEQTVRNERSHGTLRAETYQNVRLGVFEGTPPPMFFVSADSKGLSIPVSSLE